MKSRQKNKKKVLIVDDEKDICDILSLHFNLKKWESVQAYNGKEALEILKKNKSDLIILDVLMPEMDGFELLKILKYSDSYASIPVIMLTAKGEPKDLDKGISLGVEFYLPKPFRIDNLMKFVDIILEDKEFSKGLES